ncbi:MAG: HGGxSTG domain-containing protein [Methyloceanibacter sp.]
MKGRQGAGASTRRGAPCRSAAVQGKRHCRMHGGAKSSLP